MRRSRLPRTVVDLADSEAAVALGGLPYADRDAALADGPPAALELGSERSGVESDRIGVTIDRTALDRRAVVAGGRPYPAPSEPITLGDTALIDARLEVWPTTDAGLSRWRALVRQLRAARWVEMATSEAIDRLSVAQMAVHLAASGILVTIADAAHPALGLLDPALAGEVAHSPAAAAQDDLEWAGGVARQTRSAWLGHDLRLRWRSDGGSAPSLEPVPAPSVSVILVSRRPDLVEAALERVAAQVGVEFEVIVGLHHAGDESAEVTAVLSRLGLQGEALAIDPSVPFGAALNLAVERSSGMVVTKWDDDDLYGPRHLEDLVVALRRSRAQLVGKAPEFIFFEERGETVLRNPGGAETDSAVLAGGTLATTRPALDDVGGFPPLPRAVDHHLKQRYLERGLRLYRTHGFGFALTRRGNEHHTWPTDEDALWRSGVRRWTGIPSIAELGDAG